MVTTCVFCVKNPLIKVASVFALSPIVFNCSSKHKKHECDIYQSNLKLISPILIAIFQIVILVYNLRTLLSSDFDGDLGKVIRIFVSHIPTVFFPLIVLTLLFSKQHRYNEFKGLNGLSEQNYVSIDFSSKNFLKVVHRINRKYFYTAATLVGVVIMFNCYTLSKTPTLECSIRNIHLTTIIIRFSFCSYYNRFEVQFYNSIRNKCFTTIKKALTQKVETNIYFTFTYGVNSNLCYVISKHIRYLLACQQNIKYFFKFISGYYLFSLIESICMFVPFVYYLTDSILKKNYDLETYLFFFFTFGYTYSLIMILVGYEKLANGVSY